MPLRPSVLSLEGKEFASRNNNSLITTHPRLRYISDWRQIARHRQYLFAGVTMNNFSFFNHFHSVEFSIVISASFPNQKYFSPSACSQDAQNLTKDKMKVRENQMFEKIEKIQIFSRVHATL